MPKYTWTRSSDGFSRNYNAGRWLICSVFYNSSRSRDDPKCWRATTKLPGLKPVLGDYESEQAALEKCESAAAWWFERTNDNLS